MTKSGENTRATRVRRTVEELTALRYSLLAISEHSGAEATGMTLDLPLAVELKNALDALRMLL